MFSFIFSYLFVLLGVVLAMAGGLLHLKIPLLRVKCFLLH